MTFLTEIQEFYEVTLCDNDKSLQQKTTETLQIASKWEHLSPIRLSSGVPPAEALPQLSPATTSSSLKAESRPVVVVLYYCYFIIFFQFRCIFPLRVQLDHKLWHHWKACSNPGLVNVDSLSLFATVKLL